MVTATPRKGHRTHTNIVATTTVGLLVAANGNRKTLLIQNFGSVTVFIGKEDVTASGPTRGYALFQGQTFVDNASDQSWWAVTASSLADLHILEVS